LKQNVIEDNQVVYYLNKSIFVHSILRHIHR